MIFGVYPYTSFENQVIVMLQSIQKQGKRIMDAVADLNASVGALQVSAQSAVNVIASELSEIANLIAAANTLPADTSAKIEASVANINNVVSELNAAIASVKPVANT